MVFLTLFLSFSVSFNLSQLAGGLDLLATFTLACLQPQDDYA
jgi:hypothetical protein